MHDVILGEDGNLTREGTGPLVLPAPHGAELGMLRSAGVTEVAAAVRHNAARVEGVLVRLHIIT